MFRSSPVNTHSFENCFILPLSCFTVHILPILLDNYKGGKGSRTDVRQSNALEVARPQIKDHINFNGTRFLRRKSLMCVSRLRGSWRPVTTLQFPTIPDNRYSYFSFFPFIYISLSFCFLLSLLRPFFVFL